MVIMLVGQDDELNIGFMVVVTSGRTTVLLSDIEDQ